MSRILVIGAGAVGQVYAHHFARGGARVSVFVREKYAEEARRGFDLIHVHSRHKRPRSRFVPIDVVTLSSKLGVYDQVWITVPTPALLSGGLDEVLSSTGAATVVSLQPGVSVAAYLADRVQRARTVFGIIGFLSFHAPLAGSDDAVEKETGPGTAYFFPPLVDSQFSGPSDRVRAVVDTARMGGLPARAIPDAHVALGFSSSMLMPIVAALEIDGWSLEAFRGGEGVTLAVRATREAMKIIAAETKVPRPFAASLLSGSIVRMALGVAKWAAPFDVEAFLRYHFEKVGAQTRDLLAEYVRLGRKHALEHEGIDELLGALSRGAK
ncbi:MAG: 2-dehydropantoate 2-reductase N-terminal domain-containing protein [Polyangiaceae bacterium]